MAIDRIWSEKMERFDHHMRLLRSALFIDKARLLSLFVVAMLLGIGPVDAIPDTVKVRLYEARAGVPSLHLTNRVKLRAPISKMLDGRQRKILLKTEGSAVALYTVRGKMEKLLLRSKRIRFQEANERGIGLKYPGRANLFYRGNVNVSSESGNLKVINEVSARQFVYGVVSSELPLNFQKEAKKALAVLTLTRLEFLPDREMIGDSTKSELYTGCTNVRPVEKDLVDDVWKMRLRHHSNLVLPYYHSTCAGKTSSGPQFFQGNGEDLSYLTSVKCHYCKPSPFYKYRSRRIPGNKIKAIFHGSTPMVLKRDSAFRPVLVDAGEALGRISGYKAWIELGRGIGWGNIPGTRFYLVEDSDKLDWKVKSNGAGHGVGLCQWGANGLAKEGYTYKEIIKFYYPKCEIN